MCIYFDMMPVSNSVISCEMEIFLGPILVVNPKSFFFLKLPLLSLLARLIVSSSSLVILWGKSVILDPDDAFCHFLLLGFFVVVQCLLLTSQLFGVLVNVLMSGWASCWAPGLLDLLRPTSSIWFIHACSGPSSRPSNVLPKLVSLRHLVFFDLSWKNWLYSMPNFMFPLLLLTWRFVFWWFLSWPFCVYCFWLKLNYQHSCTLCVKISPATSSLASLYNTEN